MVPGTAPTWMEVARADGVVVSQSVSAVAKYSNEGDQHGTLPKGLDEYTFGYPSAVVQFRNATATPVLMSAISWSIMKARA